MEFELIRGRENLLGTCYFEFVKESERSKPCWNESAVYVHEHIVRYFIRVFSNSSDNFEYFSFCRFNTAEVLRLRSNLDSFAEQLDTIQDVRRLAPLFSNEFINVGIEDSSQTLAGKLRRLSGDLRAFVDECAREDEALWVLGI